LCLDDASTLAVVNNLAAAGIGTFVVGLPGSEPYASFLNKLAKAGGALQAVGVGDAYYPVSASNSLPELTQTFSAITRQVTQSCDIPLQQSPYDPTMVEVAIDCQRIPIAPNNDWDAGNVDGFAIDYSKSPAHLILLGASCERLQASGVHNIDVIVGCASD
jgi:hypothetical protein